MGCTKSSFQCHRSAETLSSVFTAVADGNLDVPRFNRRTAVVRLQALAHERFHVGVGAQSRIEIDQYGGVRRMQVENAADAFEGAREASHGEMGLERDLVAEREQE